MRTGLYALRVIMKVAAIQLNSQDNVAANLSQTEGVVRTAAEAGAKLVILPEAFAYLGTEEGKSLLAEEIGQPGPIQEAVSSWCRTHNIYIIAGGMPERSQDPQRPYNTSAVFAPTGKLCESYRKLHLFDVQLSDGTSWVESSATTPGDEARVAQIEQLTVGLSICYDLRFPDLFSWQRSQGAQLLTVPAAFTKTTGAAHWETLLRARAIETQCWLAAAAQEGDHPRGRKTYGHAMIIDPWGRIVSEVSEPGVGFAIAEVDLQEVTSVREQMPVTLHRRKIGNLPC
jgi:deaminated glutathione amidase